VQETHGSSDRFTILGSSMLHLQSKPSSLSSTPPAGQSAGFGKESSRARPVGIISLSESRFEPHLFSLQAVRQKREGQHTAGEHEPVGGEQRTGNQQNRR